MSKKSEPEGSLHVEKVNNECDSQAAEAVIVVSNKVPQPVSKVLTLPSGQTSLVNPIGQNEPKGSQLQLTMNDSENSIPIANDSNEYTLPQTDGTYNEDETMYKKNSAVDPNKCVQTMGENNCPVDPNQCNQGINENNCPVDPNNYIQEKTSNVAENEQIHATDGL